MTPNAKIKSKQNEMENDIIAISCIKALILQDIAASFQQRKYEERTKELVYNVIQIEEIFTNNSTSHFRFGCFGKLLTALGIS